MGIKILKGISKDILKYFGFDDEKTLIYCLLKDDMSLNQISNLLFYSPTKIRSIIKKHNLLHLIKKRGGPHLRRNRKQKWNKRAIRLGFLSEREMLNCYKNDFEELHKLLTIDILKNELSNNIPKISTLKKRYYKN